MATVIRLLDARLCRQRRADVALAIKAENAAQCAARNAEANGLCRAVVDRIADITRQAVLTGTASPGRAIGAAYTRAKRLRRSPQPGDVA